MCLFFKYEKNENQLRKEIAFTILNIQGVRVGLFTPDMAFEYITKNQIEKLVGPALKCVDLVSTEIMTVIKTTAEGVRMGVVCKIIKIIVGVVCIYICMYVILCMYIYK